MNSRLLIAVTFEMSRSALYGTASFESTVISAPGRSAVTSKTMSPPSVAKLRLSS